MTSPTTDVEERLFNSGYSLIAGMDEVGRGALAGPVTVGVVCIDSDCGPAPVGLADSKLLTPQQRTQLVDPVRNWAKSFGVGHASPQEIDHYGLTAALALAGHRALAESNVNPELVIVDGSYDWLTPRQLLQLPCLTPAVTTAIKGDLRIASIAAASIVAKTQRDELMISYHNTYPQYGWDSNKGYAAPTHREALKQYGSTDFHRRSWNLP